MIKKQIPFHSQEMKNINTLYQQAFPKNEQMDLSKIFDLQKAVIYGYYQQEQLVGFVIICIHQQIVSILYLAIQ